MLSGESCRPRDLLLQVDLHYPHSVFLPIVQLWLDNFRQMWNEHPIRGERTVDGHGGGIPSELFNDQILSETVLNDDSPYENEAGQLGLDARGRCAVDETSDYGAAVAV